MSTSAIFDWMPVFTFIVDFGIRVCLRYFWSMVQIQMHCIIFDSIPNIRLNTDTGKLWHPHLFPFRFFLFCSILYSVLLQSALFGVFFFILSLLLFLLLFIWFDSVWFESNRFNSIRLKVQKNGKFNTFHHLMRSSHFPIALFFCSIFYSVHVSHPSVRLGKSPSFVCSSSPFSHK